MLIDAHHHFWQRDRGDYGWLTAESGVLWNDYSIADLRPLCAAAGVDGVISVQAAETDAETEYLLHVAEDDLVVGVVGWMDLRRDDAALHVEKLVANPKLVAIRPMLQDDPRADWVVGEQSHRGLAALEEHDLAFDALVRAPQLRLIDRLAREHPSLRIVLDHCGKPAIAAGDLHAWHSDIARLARNDNVFCKISGLVTEAGRGTASDALLTPVVDHVAAVFGYERLLWGSDWPVVLLNGSYDAWLLQSHRLLSRQFNLAELAEIMGANAMRVYRPRRLPKDMLRFPSSPCLP